METLFFCSLLVLVYTYLLYLAVIYLLAQFNKKKQLSSYTPSITIVVPCYNEKDYILEKVKNTRELNYPNKKIIFITDGSDDGSDELLKQYNDIIVLHQPERAGKSMAENRAISFVDTEITVFTDANSTLNPDALIYIAQHFVDEKVAGVSGEKKILYNEDDGANSASEGLYWKYESLIKKYDSDFYTVVGAAGELFAVRTKLYTQMPPDSINDDLTQSVMLNLQGYKIAYEPRAYAAETASANVHEELKRKIRMCAGAWQVMARYSGLFNFLKHPKLTFQFISHRVLRWTLCPLALITLFLSNIILFDKNIYYQVFMYLQIAFYIIAILGYYINKVKILYIPFYFVFMHWAAVLGFFRFMKGKQSVNWERVKRG